MFERRNHERKLKLISIFDKVECVEETNGSVKKTEWRMITYGKNKVLEIKRMRDRFKIDNSIGRT